MPTKRKTTLKLAALLLITSTVGTAGCDPYSFFSGNANINFVVPVGLGGNPGFYNPFGLTQALVNALIGGSSSSDESGGTSSSSSSASTLPNAGVLGSIIQPGFNSGTSTNNLTGSTTATPPPTTTTTNP
jgi:hypothetical protein